MILTVLTVLTRSAVRPERKGIKHGNSVKTRILVKTRIYGFIKKSVIFKRPHGGGCHENDSFDKGLEIKHGFTEFFDDPLGNKGDKTRKSVIF